MDGGGTCSPWNRNTDTVIGITLYTFTVCFFKCICRRKHIRCTFEVLSYSTQACIHLSGVGEVVWRQMTPKKERGEFHGQCYSFPTRPDQRGSCQLSRASTIKTGVMGRWGVDATVINSREGNEVTVDSQFSQRKAGFHHTPHSPE